MGRVSNQNLIDLSYLTKEATTPGEANGKLPQETIASMLAHWADFMGNIHIDVTSTNCNGKLPQVKY